MSAAEVSARQPPLPHQLQLVEDGVRGVRAVRRERPVVPTGPPRGVFEQPEAERSSVQVRVILPVDGAVRGRPRRLPEVDPAPPAAAAAAAVRVGRSTDRERRVPPSERTAVGTVSGAERAASGHQPRRRRPEPLHVPGQRRDPSRQLANLIRQRLPPMLRRRERGRELERIRAELVFDDAHAVGVDADLVVHAVGPRIEVVVVVVVVADGGLVNLDGIVEIVGRDEVGGLPPQVPVRRGGYAASPRVARVPGALTRTAARRSGGELVVERPVVIARTTAARRSEEPIGRPLERDGGAVQL